MIDAICVVCLESLSRDEILLTNDCGHFHCQACCLNILNRWRRSSQRTIKCSECREQLNLYAPFMKPHSFSQDNTSDSKLYYGILRAMTLKHSYSRELFKFLKKKNFNLAFKICFLFNIKPNDYHESIAPGWRGRYYDMLAYSKCGLCKCTVDMDDAFVTTCGHFYCFGCSTGSRFAHLLKIAKEDLYCHSCGDILKARHSKAEFVLIRPSSSN